MDERNDDSTVLTFPLDTHIAQTQNFTARCLNYLRRVGQVARRSRVEHQVDAGCVFLGSEDFQERAQQMNGRTSASTIWLSGPQR